MRRIKVAESKSKQRLLAAAGQLFADHGFEIVSVRDITKVAKANVAAINYHFGSREGLVALVMVQYLGPIISDRVARLDELGRKEVPLEGLVDSYVRFVVERAGESGLSERQYCSLVGRILATRGEGFPVEVEPQFNAWNERFIKVLEKCLPTVEKDDLIWRVHFMEGALIRMLMDPELPEQQLGRSSGSTALDAMLSRFIRFAVAGLRAGVVEEGEDSEPGAKRGPQATFDF